MCRSRTAPTSPSSWRPYSRPDVGPREARVVGAESVRVGGARERQVVGEELQGAEQVRAVNGSGTSGGEEIRA